MRLCMIALAFFHETNGGERSTQPATVGSRFREYAHENGVVPFRFILSGQAA